MFTNEELMFLISSIAISRWEVIEEEKDIEMAEQLLTKLKNMLEQ